jgi:hypothetical protein
MSELTTGHFAHENEFGIDYVLFPLDSARGTGHR